MSLPSDSYASPAAYHEALEMSLEERHKLAFKRRYWARELARYFAGASWYDWWPSRRESDKRRNLLWHRPE